MNSRPTPLPLLARSLLARSLDHNPGEISEGFGNIVTSDLISTSATVSIAGKVQADGNFMADGDVALGDDSKDTVSFRGVLQTTISIKSEGPGPRQHGQGRRVHFDSVQAHT